MFWYLVYKYIDFSEGKWEFTEFFIDLEDKIKVRFKWKWEKILFRFFQEL
jgi:hypothetical protein